MPEFQDYTSINAADVDSDDIHLLLVDGVTHKMTADEVAKRSNSAVVNTQSGTSYTLLIGDLGKTIDMTNAGANTLTVPPDLAYPNGTRIEVCRLGAGETTIVAGSGVTIYTANDDLTISTQYSSGVLRKIGTNIWLWQGGGASSSLVPLSTPASLSMTSDGENAMDFAWSDVVNEDGYEAQIAEDAGFTVNVQTANKAAAVLTHKFSGLTADTLYYGRVKAEGDGVTYSDSGYASDSASTDAAGIIGLNIPTGFSATPDGSDMDLVWTDTNSSPNETGFEILRNSTNTTIGSTLINSPAANATSYTDIAPGAGTWYYFVKAKGNGTTTGDSSNASASGTIGASYDSDALAYFTAEEGLGGTISGTFKDAANAVVVAMKAGNLWTRAEAVHFFMGTGVLNAKNPLNTDGAHRLEILSGAPTLSANGWAFDGVDDSLNTNLVPATSLALRNESYGFYVKAHTAGYVFGSIETGLGNYFSPKDGSNINFRIQSNGDINGGANASTPGRYIVSTRTDGTTTFRRAKKNNTIFFTNDTLNGSDVSAAETVASALGAFYNDGSGLPGGFAAATLGFYWHGDGLSDAEIVELDGIIATFITATSRT